ncbi:MAG: hypothetical protein JWP81_1560 [Ferruginibacter sp.]|nr:hypothetical protein [Ferruginibacter sp.]
MPVCFCDFTEEENIALKHIFEAAFNLTDFERLLEVYGVFKSNYDGHTLANKLEVIERDKMLPKTTDQTFTDHFRNVEFQIGIDLPILVRKTGQSAKTAFIVAEDPLRDPKHPDNGIILGTPFGTHMKTGTNKNLAVYSSVIQKFLDDDYAVYLTDIYKLWIKKPGSKKLVLGADLLEKLYLSLQQEMDYFKPQLIITYGNPAAFLMKRLAPDESIKIISLPHPSGSANGTWKKILSVFHKDNRVRCTPDNKIAYIKAQIDA